MAVKPAAKPISATTTELMALNIAAHSASKARIKTQITGVDGILDPNGLHDAECGYRHADYYAATAQGAGGPPDAEKCWVTNLAQPSGSSSQGPCPPGISWSTPDGIFAMEERP